MPRRLRKAQSGDIRAVVDETIVLYQRLIWVAERIYGDDGRGNVRRGILRGLMRFGPQTVPELARARSVRRQSIQPVVDELVREGLAELVENPRHKSSKRVCITPSGEAFVERMDKVDRKVLAAVGAGLDREAIARTATTLRELRLRFETTLRWRAAVGVVG